MKRRRAKRTAGSNGVCTGSPITLTGPDESGKVSKENQLTLEKMEEIMSESEKGEITRVAFTNEQLHKYFPSQIYTGHDETEILALLKSGRRESWER